MAKKLNPDWLRILNRLNSYVRKFPNDPWMTAAWLAEDLGEKTVWVRSRIASMALNSLVKRNPGTFGYYTITDAGRAMLKEAQQ